MAGATMEWNRITGDGERLQVLAERVGNEWRFFARARRFDQWVRQADAPLEDWQALLDAVRRRIGRGLLRKEEETRIVAEIRRRFPDAEA